jgi:hypothetical protein
MGFRLGVRSRQRLHRVGQNLDDRSQPDNLSPRFEAVSVQPLRSHVCGAPARQVKVSALSDPTALFHPPPLQQEPHHVRDRDDAGRRRLIANRSLTHRGLKSCFFKRPTL